MSKELYKALRDNLLCEVLYDDVSRSLYSVDASIYEIKPQVVVIPRTSNDLHTLVEISREFHVPLISRGGATGITGACLGNGIIIDFSKYFKTILDIDMQKETAIVQPGVLQDDLNHVLAPYGYRLGPDTSTSNRATIGGMVANNAAGSHSLHYGRMVDHVEGVKLRLISNQVLHAGKVTEHELRKLVSQDSHIGLIYRTISEMRKNASDLIAREFPAIKRRSSGYNLNELIKPDFNNISKLITGSEGTFGLIEEVTLKICKKPRFVGLVVFAASNMLDALEYTHLFLDKPLYSLELVDRHIIEAGRTSPAFTGKLKWLEGSPDALILVECSANSPDELIRKCEAVSKKLPANSPFIWHKILTDQKLQDEVWQLRKSGLGLLLSKRSYNRAIAFIEDVTVPPEHVASFVTTIRKLLQAHNKAVGIYGHIGEGCLHIRPYIDLRDEKEVLLMRQIMQEVIQEVKARHGVLSGEHGDGIIRSWTNRTFFGDKIYTLFCELKNAFDPIDLMNPGKIVTSEKYFPNETMRLYPGRQSIHLDTFLNFEREGGLELATDLCNGNGLCRKKEGVMCPSFQATNNEKDSTRGRSNAFRALLQGKIPKSSLFNDEFHDVFDLCIQCKGCKTECPSQVDMAKIKSEYLYQYHTKKGFPLRSYLFGYLGDLFAIGSRFPKVSNFFMRHMKFLLSFIGITKKRLLPALANTRFSKTFKSKTTGTPIVLFSDTFTEFINPEIGHSAATLLEKLGYKVIVPSWNCCGRTFLSKGLLPIARKKAHTLVDVLYEYARKGIQICGLEPSCILTLVDEYQDLGLDKEKVAAIAKHTKTIDEVLHKDIEKLKKILKPLPQQIFLHGHCHQKALIGLEPTIAVLQAIPQATVHVIPSGCCGMAGSFGYEKEHYDVSQTIGNLVLLPTIRNLPTEALVVANGMSCRSQIVDGTQVAALHLVEILAKSI